MIVMIRGVTEVCRRYHRYLFLSRLYWHVRLSFFIWQIMMPSVIPYFSESEPGGWLSMRTVKGGARLKANIFIYRYLFSLRVMPSSCRTKARDSTESGLGEAIFFQSGKLRDVLMDGVHIGHVKNCDNRMLCISPCKRVHVRKLGKLQVLAR